MKTTSTPRQRTAARLAAGATCRSGANNTTPVIVIEGHLPPKLLGERARYTTPNGKPVRYPNAYRRAWGKPVYHCSTRRVVVGTGWLAANA